jgi:mandelate racemase
MEESSLTIQDINAIAVISPLVRPITTASGSIPAAPLVLIDVIFSDNIVGRSYLFGYTSVSLKPIVETINNLRDILLGKTLAPISLQEELNATFRLLGRQGFLGMAMAGLDMAFWDALGKARGKPVSAVLDGKEAPIPCYDSYGVFDTDTSPKELEESLELGFKAVKFKIGDGDVEKDVRDIKAIRNIIGTDINLMVDYNQSLDVPDAINRIKKISEFGIYWVEEPVLAEDFAGHVQVRNASDIAIQTGENWWFPEDAARAIRAEISDHAMLDIMKIGGVTGWLKAAKIAERASLPISSHIFIEASAHVMPSTPTAHLLEYLDVASSVLIEPYNIENGSIVPHGPGLGIEWNTKTIQEYTI